MVKPKATVDVLVSLRLKYGIHTIFLMVEALETFSNITSELLVALRERYPNGLQASASNPAITPLPEGDDVQIAYAVLRNPRDPYSGWRDLGLEPTDTPVGKGIKDNTMLAFAFAGEDEEQPAFVVEYPQLDDEEAEEGDGMEE